MRALHDCSKNAFDALQKYIFASHFVTQNVTNAFDATLTFCWCKNAFLQTKMLESGKMHFGNAYILRSKMFSITFSKGKCSAYIFLWKMFSVHFPKENVQQNKMLQMHLMLCKNAFWHQMHLMQKCI